jgi:hypothetical protein
VIIEVFFPAAPSLRRHTYTSYRLKSPSSISSKHPDLQERLPLRLNRSGTTPPVLMRFFTFLIPSISLYKVDLAWFRNGKWIHEPFKVVL